MIITKRFPHLIVTLAIMLALLDGIFLAGLQKTYVNLSSSARATLTRLQFMHEMGGAVQSLQAISLGLAQAADGQGLTRLDRRLTATRNKLGRLLDQYQMTLLVNETDRRFFESDRQAIKRYLAMIDQIAVLSRNRDFDNARQIATIDALPALDRALSAVQTHAQFTADQVHGLQDELDAFYRHNLIVSLLLMAVEIGLFGFIAWLAFRKDALLPATESAAAGNDMAGGSGEACAMASPDSTAPNEQANTRHHQFDDELQHLADSAKQLAQYSEFFAAPTIAAASQPLGPGAAAATACATLAVEERVRTSAPVAPDASGLGKPAPDAAVRDKEAGRRIQALIRNMEMIDSGYVSDFASKVAELEHRSDDIRSLLGVIRQITDQTNRLALEAALEAARVDDNGEEFDATAVQIRTLARHSASFAREVAGKVGAMQSGANGLAEAMGEEVGSMARGPGWPDWALEPFEPHDPRSPDAP